MLNSSKKSKIVKSIQNCSQNNTEKKSIKNMTSLKKEAPHDYNDINETTRKNPTHISSKNTTKYMVTPNYKNRSNHNQVYTSNLDINNKKNLIYLSENVPKSNTIRNSLKSLTSCNNFKNKYSLDKKFQNLIHEKNNDINLLQYEIEYYKNLIQNYKYKSNNNKCVLPKNDSGVFLSTVLFNKAQNPKISKKSVNLKNNFSYAKNNNLNFQEYSDKKSRVKKNSRTFKSKENSNLYNLNLDFKIYRNHKKNQSNQFINKYIGLKQNSITITTSSIRKNNNLSNTKSCDIKKKYYNSGEEFFIKDYGSSNKNINFLSPDRNISHDISSFNDLKIKKYTKTADNFYKKDNRNNRVINSKKNSSQNLDSMEEYFVNKCYYMEKCDDIMIRMEKLFDNLFSMIKSPKGFNVHQNKYKYK